MIYALAVLYVLIATVSGKVYFKEDFNDAGWKDRWAVSSDWRPAVSFHFPNNYASH